MRLYATLKNERGGKKSTSDDTRILVELSYKNKIVGTVGLYSVWEGKEDLGYRVVWSDERGCDPDRPAIREEIKSRSKLDRLLEDQDNIREQESAKATGECEMHGVKYCVHCTENPYNTI